MFALLTVKVVYQQASGNVEAAEDAIFACIDPTNRSSKDGFKIETINQVLSTFMVVQK